MEHWSSRQNGSDGVLRDVSTAQKFCLAGYSSRAEVSRIHPLFRPGLRERSPYSGVPPAYVGASLATPAPLTLFGASSITQPSTAPSLHHSLSSP